jgi:hypothetical protein
MDLLAPGARLPRRSGSLPAKPHTARPRAGGCVRPTASMQQGGSWAQGCSTGLDGSLALGAMAKSSREGEQRVMGAGEGVCKELETPPWCMSPAQRGRVGCFTRAGRTTRDVGVDVSSLCTYTRTHIHPVCVSSAPVGLCPACSAHTLARWCRGRAAGGQLAVCFHQSTAVSWK